MHRKLKCFYFLVGCVVHVIIEKYIKVQKNKISLQNPCSVQKIVVYLRCCFEITPLKKNLETNIMELSLLWNSFKGFAQRVGRRTARTPLLLYYVLKSDTTSKRDKAIIYAALAYLILPVDVIRSHRFGLLGWVDEFLAINVVFDRMQKYITPTMYAQAEKQLDEWIG